MNSEDRKALRRGAELVKNARETGDWLPDELPELVANGCLLLLDEIEAMQCLSAGSVETPTGDDKALADCKARDVAISG